MLLVIAFLREITLFPLIFNSFLTMHKIVVISMRTAYNKCNKEAITMKFYITYGTYGYLRQIQLNNKSHQLLIFSGDDQSVMIDETENETVFQQPKSYRVLTRLGTLSADNFHALISIPTTEDHKYQLENKLENYVPSLDSSEGFNSFRLLKPIHSNIYKVFFGFTSRQAYEDFKKSSAFREHFSKEGVRPLAGSSSAHASYLEQYFYPISEEDTTKES